MLKAIGRLFSWLSPAEAEAAASAGTATESSCGLSKARAGATSQIKCLLVASAFPPILGGSATVYSNLCRFAGGAVMVLTRRVDYLNGLELEDWRSHDESVCFGVVRVPLLRPISSASKHNLRAVRLLSDLGLMLRVFARVARIVRRERIAVVAIGELTYGGWLAAPCRYLLRRKVVIFVHGEELTITSPRLTIAGALRRTHLRLAHRIVAVSRFGCATLIDRFGIGSDKIELILNGVDLGRFHPRPASAALRAQYDLVQKRVLLTVGRLVERKGIDRVLEAIPNVRSRHPDLHYLIVGEGPQRVVLERMIEERALADCVTFTGPVADDDLADHYALADIFVMPNRTLASGDTEAFGVVFLEANACGVPVIAGTAGGASDVVEDGVNGLTVDGNDVGAIAAAITRLLEDPGLRARLRAGGLARAREAAADKQALRFLHLCDDLARA